MPSVKGGGGREGGIDIFWNYTIMWRTVLSNSIHFTLGYINALIVRSKGKISFINLQSQSKMLGRLTIFFPSQMLVCKIGELTAINNVCRTRGLARRKKKNNKKTALGGSIPTTFV